MNCLAWSARHFERRLNAPPSAPPFRTRAEFSISPAAPPFKPPGPSSPVLGPGGAAVSNSTTPTPPGSARCPGTTGQAGQRQPALLRRSVPARPRLQPQDRRAGRTVRPGHRLCRRHRPCLALPLPARPRHCLSIVLPLPVWLRHCPCLMLRLPSWLR